MPPKVQNWKDAGAAVDLNPTELEQAPSAGRGCAARLPTCSGTQDAGPYVVAETRAVQAESNTAVTCAG